MPYITQERRAAIHSGEAPKTAGEFNYKISMIMIEAYEASKHPNARGESIGYVGASEEIEHAARNYIQGHGISYAVINEVIGALTCAAIEFKRRVPRSHYPAIFIGCVAHGLYASIAAPYEDQKILDNGDLPYGL